MKFLRIGNVVINLANVTEIELHTEDHDGEPCATVSFVSITSDHTSYRHFYGDDAQPLCEWVAYHEQRDLALIEHWAASTPDESTDA